MKRAEDKGEFNQKKAAGELKGRERLVGKCVPEKLLFVSIKCNFPRYIIILPFFLWSSLGGGEGTRESEMLTNKLKK